MNRMAMIALLTVKKLLKRLSETINVKGINETLLKNSRRFYIEYPQIKQYLSGAKSPTTSDLSEISPTVSVPLVSQ